MAFTGNFTTDTFKQGLLNGDFDFAVDTIKIALYTNSATLNEDTTAYTTTGEVVATGSTTFQVQFPAATSTSALIRLS
jgi:hypothetical protein